MALINVRCSAGHVTEVVRLASEWPATPPCSLCACSTEQIHLPPQQRARSVDPVVVYQAPDGTYRFPPDISTSSTKMYDDMGYKRIEARGFAEVRHLEGRMNKDERSHMARLQERRQEQFEKSESARRSEVRRCLEQGFRIPETDERGRPTGRMKTVELSPRGRAIMQAAMSNNDRKGGPKMHDPGVHVEAYSSDRSNRAADPRRSGQ